MSDRVRVYTRPDVRDYDVVIEAGALDRLGDFLAEHARAHAYAIISDATVARIYGERALHAARKTGAACALYEFPPGERHKTVATWQDLTERLLAEGYGRDACIIALGGGVTGDIAGFVAATYMRGIPVVQVPTTLLAMIDAAVGGKTGVDTGAGKNLIGAFHQPHVVVSDPHVLRTLPPAELRFGLAEAVKHGAIADAEYLAWLAQSAPAIFDHKTHTLLSLITRSVEIKAHFVSEDVHERGARAALNFGHTIAHALEHVSDYTLPHGHAVALGMLVETIAGETHGLTQAGTAQHLSGALHALGLPTQLPHDIDPVAVLGATGADKKSRAGTARYTLLRRTGAVASDAGCGWTWALPDDVVNAALAQISQSGTKSAAV